MKVLLVSPINRTYVVMPNLGLGYLARVLREEGHSVYILHCMKEKMSFRGFENFLKKNRFDIIGFQCFSYDLNSVKKHIEIVKRAVPSALVLVGGPHPSGDPQGTLDYLQGADFAFKGEAEIGLPMLIRSFTKAGLNGSRWQLTAEEAQHIPGLIWRNCQEVRANKPAHVGDLDTIGFPCWDLMDPRQYPEAPHGAFAKNFPVAPIIITRGCPKQCTFCAGKTITGKKIRKRSIDNVIQEVKFLQREYGIQEFTVEDENFTLFRDLVIEFCQRLITEDLRITWSCPAGVRLDTLDREILAVMERAGCHSFGVGVESSSDQILRDMKKDLTVEQIRNHVSLIAGHKIKTTGFFILGYPTETIQDMQASTKFARELNIDRVQFNNFMPLPGSEIYEILKREGKLSHVSWDSLFVHDVAYTPEGISPKTLKNLQRMAYLRFYLRPKILLRLLREIRSFKHLRFLTKRLVDAFSWGNA